VGTDEPCRVLAAAGGPCHFLRNGGPRIWKWMSLRGALGPSSAIHFWGGTGASGFALPNQWYGKLHLCSFIVIPNQSLHNICCISDVHMLVNLAVNLCLNLTANLPMNVCLSLPVDVDLGFDGRCRALTAAGGPWRALTTHGRHWRTLAGTGYRWRALMDLAVVSSFVAGWGWSDASPTHDVSPPA
jgi:hypothetical protein